MDYDTHFKECGWQCKLVKPWRGYHHRGYRPWCGYHEGIIIGKSGNFFVVKFFGGATAMFNADEIYFD